MIRFLDSLICVDVIMSQTVVFIYCDNDYTVRRCGEELVDQIMVREVQPLLLGFLTLFCETFSTTVGLTMIMVFVLWQ